MYARLDDELIDHRKVFTAGESIGRNGPAIAIGFYAVGLMWVNKHLTDGHIPLAVVRNFRHVDQPLKVAAALVRAGLWEKNGGDGFTIHHYREFGNPMGVHIRARRKADRIRKARERAKGKRA